MLIKEAEIQSRAALSTIYDEREASAITDMLMEYVTGLKRIDRLVSKETSMTTQQQRAFEHALQELLMHRPVQYVIHTSWFYGMELYVDEHVLIPRPETEELVAWIVYDVSASGKAVFNQDPLKADQTGSLKILDVGTGSGCIALALKKAMPKAEVWACDASEQALDVARRNSATLNIRVDYQGLDFLNSAQQRQLPTVDIVVSNPPYIPYQEKAQMAPNVVNFEPHQALFVPNNDPLVFYKALSTFGKHRLYPGGSMYLEIHENFKDEIVDLFANDGYISIEVRKDMQGKDRMIKVAI